MLIKTTAERYPGARAGAARRASLRTSRDHRGPNRARTARLPRLGGRRNQPLKRLAALFFALPARRAGAGAAQARRLGRRPARAGEGVPLLSARADRRRGRGATSPSPRATTCTARGSASASRATGVQLGAPELPRGARHKDEFFGEVEIYRKDVRIRIPAQGEGRFDLKVISQGCADVGVCYVPMESKASLRLAARRRRRGGRGAVAVDFRQRSRDRAPVRGQLRRWCWRCSSVFGLLLTFTPCVLPMIPILSGIIAGEGAGARASRARSRCPLTYVLGMALDLRAGRRRPPPTRARCSRRRCRTPGCWAPSRWSSSCSRSRCSACTSCGCPASCTSGWTPRSARLRGGRIASVAGMGVLSAVIVSPCVAAPLAGALLYIAQTRDVALGGAALFAMALGMGVPLIVVGVSEGALLPKSGPWMVRVKQVLRRAAARGGDLDRLAAAAGLSRRCSAGACYCSLRRRSFSAGGWCAAPRRSRRHS